MRRNSLITSVLPQKLLGHRAPKSLSPIRAWDGQGIGNGIRGFPTPHRADGEQSKDRKVVGNLKTFPASRASCGVVTVL